MDEPSTLQIRANCTSSSGQRMAYWVNLFTGTTWREFQNAGAKVSGFREQKRNWTVASNLTSGDIFLCYMVGVKRWVGLLEIISERFRDDAPIFKADNEVFPVRFKVNPIVMLAPEHGVPMQAFEGKIAGYPAGASSSQWAGMVRASLRKLPDPDGLIIADAILAAKESPVARPVDARQLQRPANLYKMKAKTGDEEIETVVSVPSVEDEEKEESAVHDEATPTHSEIQWRLLNLGAQMGLNIWAPKGDRTRRWKS